MVKSSPSISQTTHSNHHFHPTNSNPPHEAEETAFMPHDSPLHAVHFTWKVRNWSYKLKLESKEKAKVVFRSDDERLYFLDSTGRGKLCRSPSDETEVLVPRRDSHEIIEEHGKVREERRSAKDKGKAIMEEPATPKKVKKRTQGIDWNDPSVLRYHALKNKPMSIAQARRNMITYLKNQGGYKESYFKRMSYNDIRPIFERVWDHVNTFIPIRFEVEKDSSKPSERETSKTVKEEKWITPDAITEEEWGFEHTKAVFLNEIIPFLKTLKDIFNVFDKDLLNEVTKVQTVFNQIEAAVQQYVMLCVMNSTTVFGDSVNLEMQISESCDKCSDLDAEIFENNDLKAQLQAKDTTIRKLKKHIKSMRENDKEEKVKQDMNEIETINIELEHSVAKLLSQNELLHKEIKHLNFFYKDRFDSIKKTRVLSKEHCDSLIAQLNSKSMENANSKCQIQERVFVKTTLQNKLRRLKGKNVLDNGTTITNATTTAPGMFKLDLDPLAPRLLKNWDTHLDYLKYTQSQADILWGIVKQAKEKQPLDNALEFACKHGKRIQELLVYVRDTCPNANKPTNLVPPKETTSHSVETQKLEIKVYSRRPKQVKSVDVPSSSSLVNDRLSRLFSCIWTPDAQTYDRKPLSAHELFGQYSDSDLEDAFWKNTCFIRNLDGVDLLLGSKDTNLYTISLDDMLKTSLICLLSKASKTKSWLWHCHLSHLNSGTLNKLAKDGLARGIPKLKFKKDHLCSACALGKSKKSYHQPKAEDTN
ncbi:integrase, catalytic region, zinc finger, CCHC-type containing protein [Tanacetum coccineum]